jgi:hypothetical protein
MRLKKIKINIILKDGIRKKKHQFKKIKTIQVNLLNLS